MYSAGSYVSVLDMVLKFYPILTPKFVHLFKIKNCAESLQAFKAAVK